MKAAPPTRAVTFAPGKYAREMALVNEAALEGDLGELAARVFQEFFGALDAHFGQPPAGWHARRPFKRPRKVAARQSALMRDLCDRRIVCQIDVDEVAGAFQLPRRKTAAGVASLDRDAAVSAHNVSEKSKRDTVGKHRGFVARLLHRAGERLRQTEHDQIAGTKIRRVKSFRPANSGFIGHLIKRNLSDVKANRVERDVQTDDRMVAEVNQLRIAETQLGHISAPSCCP